MGLMIQDWDLAPVERASVPARPFGESPSSETRGHGGPLYGQVARFAHQPGLSASTSVFSRSTNAGGVF
jgi:hypothetical protein